MILYHVEQSRSFRVLWALEELGLPYELRVLEVEPRLPRFNYPDYLEINPLGTFPALVDSGKLMTESALIPHYLATRYAGDDLVIRPEEADYATYLNFLSHGESTLTFPQSVYLRFTWLEPDRKLQEAGQLYQEWFIARCALLDIHLQQSDYVCGGRFTLADISIAYAAILAEALGYFEQIPESMQSHLSMLRKREGYQRALTAERDPANRKPAGRPLTL